MSTKVCVKISTLSGEDPRFIIFDTNCCLLSDDYHIKDILTNFEQYVIKHDFLDMRESDRPKYIEYLKSTIQDRFYGDEPHKIEYYEVVDLPLKYIELMENPTPDSDA